MQALPTATRASSVPIRKAKFTPSPPSAWCDTQHTLLLSSTPFFWSIMELNMNAAKGRVIEV